MYIINTHYKQFTAPIKTDLIVRPHVPRAPPQFRRCWGSGAKFQKCHDLLNTEN